MTEFPGFGVLLTRLSSQLGLDLDALAARTGTPEPELRKVFRGATPTPVLLHRLAPALNLRVPDLYVIAGLNVPEELAPLDELAGGSVPWMAMRSRQLSPSQRGQLLAFTRALPQEKRTRPVRPPRGYERYDPSYGAMLLLMLANRNLTWTSGAKALHAVSGPYLSGATVGQLARNRKPLTPDLLIPFANVLGMPADHLAALTDIALPFAPPPHDPELTDAAELIWEARRLSAGQVSQVGARLEALLEG